MLSQDSEDDIRSRFAFELAIWLWQDELNPRVRCAFGNVLYYHWPKVNCLLLTGKRDAVPVRLNGAANLIVIVARRSKQCRGCLFFCQLSSQLWSLPGIFLLEIVCEFSHFQESWDVAMSALLGTRPSNSCTFCKKHYLSPLTLLTSLVFVNNGLSNIDFWLSKPEVCLKTSLK